MAQEYGLVLRDMGVNITVAGRGLDSASLFEQRTGIKPRTGGVEKYLREMTLIPDAAIIAVKVKDLFAVCKLALDSGIKRILLEKPGALYSSQIEELCRYSENIGADIYIAYNRRFYSTVLEAEKMLVDDGGVKSMIFEFTEWSDRVEVFDTDIEEKQRWFLSNSSHVADLAFHIGGLPVELQAYSGGSLKWHEKGSVFCGCGRTDKNVLFSYAANWNAPGRWGLEFLSENLRIILRPIEQLQVINKGELIPRTVEIDNNYDRKYKPGLFRMVHNFLNGPGDNLCSISEQVEMFGYYCRIANYL